MNQEKATQNNSYELPPPAAQQNEMVSERDAARSVEQSAPSNVATQSGATQSHATQPSSSGLVQQPLTTQPVSNIVHTPQIADDEDLIEREWVDSAKRIVAQTKGDPHAQSDGISAIKGDYKKKRFNIDADLGSKG